MNEPALAVENLGVERGKRLVLEGVSCVAARGEVLAILGPNGSGKTTLLRAMAEAGTSVRCSQPTNGRSTWGTTRPTNPMLPPSETAAPVKTETHTMHQRRAADTSTPNARASSSPLRSMSSDRPQNHAAAMPTITSGAATRT